MYFHEKICEDTCLMVEDEDQSGYWDSDLSRGRSFRPKNSEMELKRGGLRERLVMDD